MARVKSRTAKRRSRPRAQVAYRYGAVPLAPPGGWGVYDYDGGGIAEVKTGMFAKRNATALASAWNAEVIEGAA